jgi:hypothetical protein
MDQPEDIWLAKVLYFETKFDSIQKVLSGDPLAVQLDMDPTPSLESRLSRVIGESKYSTSEPTATHQMSLRLVQQQVSSLVPVVNALLDQEFRAFKLELQEAGAPYVPGMLPGFKK